MKLTACNLLQTELAPVFVANLICSSLPSATIHLEALVKIFSKGDYRRCRMETVIAINEGPQESLIFAIELLQPADSNMAM